MNLLKTLTSNYIINVGVTSFVLAQLLKTIFTLISTKRLDLERLTGAGGMPSSHSAMTCSVAIGMANKLGADSPEFGLALCFAAIVMYDAMGVRRAAGEQAKVINRMVFEFPLPFFQKLLGEHESAVEEEVYSEERSIEQEAEAAPLLNKELKEFLGHTPLEVAGGCLLGILVAAFMPVV